MFKIIRELRTEDLNNPYRHIHHAQSLYLLEEARLAFMKHIGFSSDSFIEKNIYPIIIEVQVRYRRELASGPVTITCEEGRVERTLLHLRQRILCPDGKAAVVATITSALMDGSERNMVVPPPEFVKAFEEFGA